MGDLRACLKSKLATSPICSDGSGVYLFDIFMDSLDDIFGGLAGSLPHIGDPDRQHIPSIPFLCAEDVIEHHEHGSNMSPNASFEADKDLHNPKKRRGKGRATKLTEEEIRARKAEQTRECRARKKVKQQEAARDLAARLAGMECAGSEIAKQADAKMEEARAYVESDEATRELRRVQAELNTKIAEAELAVTGKISCRRSASWCFSGMLLGQVFQY